MLMTISRHWLSRLVLLVLTSCQEGVPVDSVELSTVQPGESLEDAVAAAKASGARVLKLAPGDYPVSSTLVIDFPLELRGSQVMEYDADGWPTGVVAGSETRILPGGVAALASVVRLGNPEGPVTSGLTIKDLTVVGGTGGVVTIVNVQGFTFKSNLIRGGSIGMSVANSSGKIVGNHMTTVGACGACIGAGSAVAPAHVEFVGNRSVANGGGVLLNGSSTGVPTAGDFLYAVVKNNDLSGHTQVNFGFGIRIFIIRKDNGAAGDTQTIGNVTALIADNRFSGNEMNYVIDAGFPYRRYPGPTFGFCDPRTYDGSFDLTMRDNDVSPSRIPSLVSFTRVTATINPATYNNWQFLHGATYTIDDPDGDLGAYRLDHPASDWASGPCPGDAAAEALGNTLVYNGATVATNAP